MSEKPLLSIIIPAHNEANRLPPSLAKVDAFLQSQNFTYEVLIVENGSHDDTLALAQAWAESHPYLRVLQSHERGKGLAVRTGMLAAEGQYRFMCDADLSMPIEQVLRFLPPAVNDFDIAIGSREAPSSNRYNEPPFTHFRGRVFSTLVKWVAVPGFEDTQCGFKCFTAQAANDLFSVQTFGGMSFDVELLYIARKRGYRVREIAIDWYFDTDTRVRMIDDTLRMFRDVFTIRKNWRQGKYAPRKPAS
ncbi:MAG TPA: glycosyltransferase family 2 protein [Anaerolineales bacterium]|nr:glycosyltransferase family 2 protein [Anaerolineales bacterium]